MNEASRRFPPPRRSHIWLAGIPFALALVSLFVLGTDTNLSLDVAPDRVTIQSSSGDDATLTAATPDRAGLLTASDKSKIDTWSLSGRARLIGVTTLAATTTSAYTSTGLSLPPPPDVDVLRFQVGRIVNVHQGQLAPLTSSPPSSVGATPPSPPPGHCGVRGQRYDNPGAGPNGGGRAIDCVPVPPDSRCSESIAVVRGPIERGVMKLDTKTITCHLRDHVRAEVEASVWGRTLLGFGCFGRRQPRNLARRRARSARGSDGTATVKLISGRPRPYSTATRPPP